MNSNDNENTKNNINANYNVVKTSNKPNKEIKNVNEISEQIDNSELISETKELNEINSDDQILITASRMYGEYYVIGVSINNKFYNNYDLISDDIINDNISMQFIDSHYSLGKEKETKEILTGSIVKDKDGYYKFIPRQESWSDGVGINKIDMKSTKISVIEDKYELEKYKNYVKDYLKSVKLSNAGVRIIDVIEVDLDNDGINEKIIQATNDYSELVWNNEEKYAIGITNELEYNEIGAYNY
jgi:hypothetical protein